MENIIKKLEELGKKRNNYKFITEKLSNPYLSDSERNNFVNANKAKIKELNLLNKEIYELEWDLMTPKQQKDYLDKYSDE